MTYLCADRYSRFVSLNVSATSNRSSGVAPLGVVFDASATTDSSLTNAFTQPLYIWDFDDSGSGNFSYGARTISKNWSHGPIAAHVYTTAGTYNPTVMVFNGYIAKTYSLSAITVTNPDTVYSTTNTICVSTAGDFTGKPTGATEVTSSDFDAGVVPLIASGKRVLLRRGETFASSATGSLASAISEGTLGAFGTGDKPIVDAGAGNSSHIMLRFGNAAMDLRVMDINFTSDGGGAKAMQTNAGGIAVTGVTVLRVDIDTTGCIATAGPDVYDDLVVADSVFSDHQTVYLRARRFAFLGNSMTDTTGSEHVLRLQAAISGVIQANNLSTPAGTKYSLTIRGPSWDGTNPEVETVLGAGAYTEKVCVIDNKITGSGETNAIPVQIAPSSDATDQRHRNILFERNWVVGVTDGQQSLLTSRCYPGPFVMKNNIGDASGHGSERNGWFFDASGSNGLTNDGMELYNNSFIDRTGTGACRGIMFFGVGVRNGVAKNNVGFAVDTVGITEVMISNTGTSCTASTNSSTAQFTGTCPYTDTTPTDPNAGEFAPANYAVGGGDATVHVYDDFHGTRRSYGNATPVIDMGAVQS